MTDETTCPMCGAAGVPGQLCEDCPYAVPLPNPDGSFPAKDIRCTACGAEFMDDEIPDDATQCPTCGSIGVPMRIADDVQVTINKHELRLLCIWADNWAQQVDRKEGNGHCKRSLGGVVHRLNKQLPGVPLTMAAEFQEVADTLQSEIEVHDATGRHVVKPKGQN